MSNTGPLLVAHSQLLFLCNTGHLPTGGIAHSGQGGGGVERGPPTSVVIQENSPVDLHRGQSDGVIFSVRFPFPRQV